MPSKGDPRSVGFCLAEKIGRVRRSPRVFVTLFRSAVILLFISRSGCRTNKPWGEQAAGLMIKAQI
jgi:hypothetical protein